jgi:hypothetical protein
MAFSLSRPAIPPNKSASPCGIWWDPALGTRVSRRGSPSYWGPVGVPSTTEKRRETAGVHGNEDALLKAQIAPSSQVR